MARIWFSHLQRAAEWRWCCRRRFRANMESSFDPVPSLYSLQVGARSCICYTQVLQPGAFFLPAPYSGVPNTVPVLHTLYPSFTVEFRYSSAGMCQPTTPAVYIPENDTNGYRQYRHRCYRQHIGSRHNETGTIGGTHHPPPLYSPTLSLACAL